MKPRTLFLALFVSLLFWVAVGFAVAHAAEPTRAQVKHAVDPAFRKRQVGVAALAIAALADVLTTEAALHRGCHEANPIYGPHPGMGPMLLSHAGVVALAAYSRAPAWADYAGAALFTAISIHNATLRCKP